MNIRKMCYSLKEIMSLDIFFFSLQLFICHVILRRYIYKGKVMKLPRIDLFKTPYSNTYNGRNVKIEDTFTIAEYVALNAAQDNGLSFHINDMIRQHPSWLQHMVHPTPPELARYQLSFESCNSDAVSHLIRSYEHILTDEQCLFHGGFWSINFQEGASFTTTRPLSTTLCPNIALGELMHSGKAFKNGRFDIFALTVRTPQTNVYVYDFDDADKGHEKEVLFAAGARLTLMRYKYVGELTAGYCPPGEAVVSEKVLPVYIFDVEIS